jgi:hypothetical protein
VNLRSARLPLILGIALVSSFSARAAQIQPAPLDSPVLGDWHGESVCVVREGACRDEDSLYHVTNLPEKAAWFSMKLDKIVDGKPVTMGTTECSHSPAARTLTCEFPKGVLRFIVIGNKMEGTMTLSNGTLWRKLTLKRLAH